MARSSMKDKIDFWTYRLKTVANSFKVLYTLPPEKVQAFVDSYMIYDYDWADEGPLLRDFGPNYTDAIKEKLVDWYCVINHLCALGQVEKMYIPPAIDLTKGIIQNQILFERAMAQDLGLKKGSKVLDVGCGRGRVASHMAMATGAKVTGVNVDHDQLASAKLFSKAKGLGKQCNFQEWDLNKIPFPFENEAFDAIYEIQVFSLSKDRVKLFKELYRMLKPGGKFGCLEWIVMDNYDPKNKHHKELMKLTKPLIGAIGDPRQKQYADELREAGFDVQIDQNMSVDGLQSRLIDKADKFYTRFAKVLNALVKMRIVPKHFNILFERLSRGGQAFVEADRLRLLTTSHYYLAQKPK